MIPAFLVVLDLTVETHLTCLRTKMVACAAWQQKYWCSDTSAKDRKAYINN